MNKARLYSLIDGTEPLQNEKDLPLLKSVIENFPYYPTSYLLLSKLLYEQDSIYFDKYLKLAAAYVGDRELLYNYLHQNSNHDLTEASGEEPVAVEENVIREEKPQSSTQREIVVPTPTESKQEELPPSPKSPIIDHVMMTVDEEAMEADVPEHKTEMPSTSRETTPRSEEAFSQEVIKPPVPEEAKVSPRITEEVKKPAKDELVFLPASSYDYFAVYPINKKEEIEDSEEDVIEERASVPDYELKQETFDTKKPHSFSEWLSYVSSQPKEKDQTKLINREVKGEESPNRTEEIIDTFLSSEGKPKPKPAKFFSPQEMAMKSVAEDNSLITETLANIYLRQQLYDKAIEIFQQLSLRYPQKSDYFAVQIKEIKKIKGA